MCVGAQWPRAPHSAVLLLGLVLGAAARLSCGGSTYPEGNRCCNECLAGEWLGQSWGGVAAETWGWGPGTEGRGHVDGHGGTDGVYRAQVLRQWTQDNRVGGLEPAGQPEARCGGWWPGHAESRLHPATGYGMESRCSGHSDTVCSPCESGFYNEAPNYEACKPCTQCNQSEPSCLAPMGMGGRGLSPQSKPQTTEGPAPPRGPARSRGTPGAASSSQGCRGHVESGGACTGHVAVGADQGVEGQEGLAAGWRGASLGRVAGRNMGSRDRREPGATGLQGSGWPVGGSLAWVLQHALKPPPPSKLCPPS